MSVTSKRLVTESPEETRALGERIGRAARPGLILALHGDLGAGKTALTQGIAAGMGVAERVTSPTFVLVNEYVGAHGVRLIHVDAYRLDEQADAAAAEATSFGLDEIIAAAAPQGREPGAVVVIEWAERVAALLPDERVEIRLEAVDGLRRCIWVEGYGPAGAAYVAGLFEPGEAA
jgi:tRNA threonylcarbamoyladenosine biosynthesis protein TsaE